MEDYKQCGKCKESRSGIHYQFEDWGVCPPCNASNVIIEQINSVDPNRDNWIWNFRCPDLRVVKKKCLCTGIIDSSDCFYLVHVPSKSFITLCNPCTRKLSGGVIQLAL